MPDILQEQHGSQQERLTEFDPFAKSGMENPHCRCIAYAKLLSPAKKALQGRFSMSSSPPDGSSFFVEGLGNPSSPPSWLSCPFSASMRGRQPRLLRRHGQQLPGRKVQRSQRLWKSKSSCGTTRNAQPALRLDSTGESRGTTTRIQGSSLQRYKRNFKTQLRLRIMCVVWPSL